MENVRGPKIDYNVIEESTDLPRPLTMGGSTVTTLNTRELPLFRKERLSPEEKGEYGFPQQVEPQQVVAAPVSGEVPLFVRGNLTPEEKAGYMAVQQATEPVTVGMVPNNDAQVQAEPQIVPLQPAAPVVQEPQIVETNTQPVQQVQQVTSVEPVQMVEQSQPFVVEPQQSPSQSTWEDPTLGVGATILERQAQPVENVLVTPQQFEEPPVQAQSVPSASDIAAKIEEIRAGVLGMPPRVNSFAQALKDASDRYNAEVARANKEFLETVAAAEESLNAGIGKDAEGLNERLNEASRLAAGVTPDMGPIEAAVDAQQQSFGGNYGSR